MENYIPKEAEKKWLDYWKKNKIYKFDEKSKGKTFAIDTPPPTVSGHMHIGHAFSYSQEDFIARYKRMRGFNVFYPFGTDDNGLATERLVEKMKAVRGVNMPRDKFVELCFKTVNEFKPEFLKPWKELGMSCDFEETYSTIDEHSRKTSQASFIELFHKNLVYQKDAPTIWCVECQTAIAQAELKDVELNSHFNDVVFKCGNEDLIIATTRPELLPACVGLAINPGDKRAKKLKGKMAKVPLFNYEVPIFEDDKVKLDKGSGIVFISTFGDPTDIEWWKKFNLPLRAVLNKDGTMNELAGKYKGAKIKDARRFILKDLKENGLLKEQKQIKHAVNTHERCGTEVEFLKTKQWFVRILDKKEELLEAGQKIKWKPEFMLKRYQHWVENLQWDWCISRQRFFGVPFPIWYCKKCNDVIIADLKELPVDPLFDKPKKKCHCGSSEFIVEKDVMDTWATSSVTPQIALNWIKDDKKFKQLFPMDLRPQAQDIITTWAFYTIVKSLFMHKSIPWKNIMISGYVLDPEGEKMSKSKGNTMDPLIIMEQYNADSLRFWAAGSKLGDDISYQEKEVVSGNKTITKLWNAAKLVFMNLKDYRGEKASLEIMDKWMLSKLNNTIKNCTENFDNYEYSKSKFEAEMLFWKTFCDNYLEIIKNRLYNKDSKGRKGAQYTLHVTLNSILKLFAPFLPYITEEIYQIHFAKEEKCKSIHISQWPEADKKMIDNKIEEIGDRFVEILNEVRRFKAKSQVSMKHEINLTLTKDDEKKLKDVLEDLKAVTYVRNLSFGKELSISL